MNAEKKTEAHILGTERIRAVLVAVCLSLVLAACGGGGGGTGGGSSGGSTDPTPDSTPTPTPDSTPTPTPDPAPTPGGGTGGGGGGSAGGGGAGSGGGSGGGTGGGGGGVSSGGGGTTTSVCGTTESYCHTIEKQLNAADSIGDLQFFAAILQELSDTASQNRNELPDSDFYSLDPVQQQALTDLYYQRQAALDPPPARQPAAPPPDLTIPAAGSYTGGGNVKSWGVWADKAAPATGQKRFGVGLLTDEHFFASYQVTGIPSSEHNDFSGTATWGGEYEGVYQLGDDDGVWGAQKEDSGTASISVDFDNTENAVTVTLTSDTTDARTFPGGSDSGGDTWTQQADLNDPKNTFDSDRETAKKLRAGDEYSKIAGAVFDTDYQFTILAGVYEFEHHKDHASLQVDTDNDGTDDAPAKVGDLRGAGWFGGCKDSTDISCFGVITEPEPDPVTDPDPDPVTDPVTPPGTYSHLSFGAWADKPGDFDAASNDGDLTASLAGTDYYYLRGTRTSADDMEDLPSTGTATWAGTYEGQYRTNPADSSGWGNFANDSGTVAMEMDLRPGNLDITLTSTTGNTFPGLTNDRREDTPKNSYVFFAPASFSGSLAGSFTGGQHTDESSIGTGVISGAFFGAEAAEAGGVYSITQTATTTGIQVDAVGVFGATKQ